MRAVLLAVLLGGCSQILGLGDVTATNTNPDAHGGSDGAAIDATIDAAPGTTIALSGQITAFAGVSFTPLAGASIAAFRSSDETIPFGSTTTDANGAFSVQIPNSALPFDGFLHAVSGMYDDTYVYPSSPWTADDATIAVTMIKPADIDGVSSQYCGYGLAGKGLISVTVTDANGAKLSGSTVSSVPVAGKVCYFASTGIPDSNLMSTSTPGVGFLLGVNGTTTVNGGPMMFHTHAVNARAGTFTQTTLRP